MYNKVPPAVDSVGVNSKEKIEFSLIEILQVIIFAPYNNFRVFMIICLSYVIKLVK